MAPSAFEAQIFKKRRHRIVHASGHKQNTRKQPLAHDSFILGVRAPTRVVSLYYPRLTANIIYVTRSRKRGPFPQKSVCELDLSADSAKGVVHSHENRLTLARSVPKL